MSEEVYAFLRGKTIEERPMTADLKMLRELERKILWLACWTVSPTTSTSSR
jgi:hypothetical protein